MVTWTFESPILIPLDPDTILNCLPAFVTTAEPVDVIESSVRYKNPIPEPERVKLNVLGFKLFL